MMNWSTVSVYSCRLCFRCCEVSCDCGDASWISILRRYRCQGAAKTGPNPPKTSNLAFLPRVRRRTASSFCREPGNQSMMHSAEALRPALTASPCGAGRRNRSTRESALEEPRAYSTTVPTGLVGRAAHPVPATTGNGEFRTKSRGHRSRLAGHEPRRTSAETAPCSARSDAEHRGAPASRSWRRRRCREEGGQASGYVREPCSHMPPVQRTQPRQAWRGFETKGVEENLGRAAVPRRMCVSPTCDTSDDVEALPIAQGSPPEE